MLETKLNKIILTNNIIILIYILNILLFTTSFLISYNIGVNSYNSVLIEISLFSNSIITKSSELLNILKEFNENLITNNTNFILDFKKFHKKNSKEISEFLIKVINFFDEFYLRNKILSDNYLNIIELSKENYKTFLETLDKIMSEKNEKNNLKDKLEEIKDKIEENKKESVYRKLKADITLEHLDNELKNANFSKCSKILELKSTFNRNVNPTLRLEKEVINDKLNNFYELTYLNEWSEWNKTK